MVKLHFKKRVIREDNDEDNPMYVEIPNEIIDTFRLNDGDEVEWSFEINCKNQKLVTFTHEYKGF